MTEILFAKTRHTYDSYTDFWRLVELSEYPVVYVDEIDRGDSNKIYLTAPFNGEHHALSERPRKSKVILWNLERPAGSGSIQDYQKHLWQHLSEKRIDKVIVSDKTLSKVTGFQYVPVGSHVGLGTVGTEKIYDFIHLMCYSNRRGFIFHEPTKIRTIYSGCSIAENGWGEERHHRLMQSKFMLNIHQDDDLIMEPLRFALAAAYGLPILTENLYEASYPYVVGVFQFPKDDIASAMRMAVRNYRSHQEAAIQQRGLVTGPYSFRGCIERFLK